LLQNLLLFDIVDRRLRCLDIRLGLIELRAIVVVDDFDEQLAGLDRLEVLNRNVADVTGALCGKGRKVGLEIASSVTCRIADPTQTFQSRATTQPSRTARSTMKIRIAAPDHRETNFRAVAYPSDIFTRLRRRLLPKIDRSVVHDLDPIVGALRLALSQINPAYPPAAKAAKPSSRSVHFDRRCRHRLRQKISGEIIDECPQLRGLVSACRPHRTNDLDTVDVLLEDVNERAFLDLPPRAKIRYTSDTDAGLRQVYKSIKCVRDRGGRQD